MSSQKVLISYDEYVTLKSFKEKYIDLKRKTVQSDEAYDAQKKGHDQTGSGGNVNAELEKVIVLNEREREVDNPPQPKLLESNTVPEVVKDISKPISDFNAPQGPSQTQKKSPDSKTVSVSESSPDPWYFIGIPKQL